MARPNEGILNIYVELSPIAAPKFEVGRLTDEGVEINRTLERCLKESRCLDLESLCIVSGEKVWSIRLDIQVLNHCGNLADAASTAGEMSSVLTRSRSNSSSPQVWLLSVKLAGLT